MKIFFLTLVIFSVHLLGQELTHENVNFTIREIPTPAVKAFYIGRGFSVEQIKPYSDTCVYTTTMRNDHRDKDIHYLRETWFATHNSKKIPIQTNTYWKKQFSQNEISPSSWIAFRLSQMPEEQVYGANGGWNQGIFSVNIPHGSTFDLTITWDIQGEKHELTIQKISCSK